MRQRCINLARFLQVSMVVTSGPFCPGGQCLDEIFIIANGLDRVARVARMLSLIVTLLVVM